MVRSIESLVHSNIKLFSLPTVFFRLNELVDNPCSSILDLGQAISGDQGLTARILKLANSPLCGFPSKIDTISQAVLLIGTQQIRDMALATSILNIFRGISSTIISMESFWRHSLCTGLIARVIAGYHREPNVERYFTAGILHDIGKLISCTSMPHEYEEALQRAMKEKEPLYKIERDMFGFDHTDIGHAFLKAWKLPSILIEATGYHHSPLKSRQFPAEASIIHIADVIAHALQIGRSGERLVPPFQEETWKSVNLQTGLLPLIIEQSMNQLDVTINILLPGKNA